jgi:hypothetical protein
VKRLKVAALLLVLAITASALSQDTIAYVVPAGIPGNQQFTGSLGLDFNVVSDIVVTQLGVFHDGTNFPDLQVPLQARLYLRDDTNVCNFTLLATLDFPVHDQGTPMDSSFFKPLPNPITLPAGSTATMVASGYGATEPNGNGFGGNVIWYTDDGGGLISFVGGGRYGDPNHPSAWPIYIDGGPPNRYAAGTFIYHAATGGDAPAPPVGVPKECGSGKGIDVPK